MILGLTKKQTFVYFKCNTAYLQLRSRPLEGAIFASIVYSTTNQHIKTDQNVLKIRFKAEQ